MSQFRGGIEFLNEIGLYDVVLPFLLIFTIVFAILEKTRIFGEHKVHGEMSTKKNLNAVTAFIIAFLGIASTTIVGVINEVVANVVLMLILIICFMILAGSFHGDKQFNLEEKKPWIFIFMAICFGGIFLIFLNAVGWLEWIISLFYNLDIEWVSSLVFMLIVTGIVFLIIQDPKKDSKK